MATRTRKVRTKRSRRTRRPKKTRRTRKFGLRTKSLTRPGRLDFVTHKGDKVFHRRGHYVKPKLGCPKPYQGGKKSKKSKKGKKGKKGRKGRKTRTHRRRR